MAAIKATNMARQVAYQAGLKLRAGCQGVASASFGGYGLTCVNPRAPNLVPIPQAGTPAAAAAAAGPPVPQITPQEAAYTAVVQLKLPTVKPGIGPSPVINPWKIAVVGYPLWLWAAGSTHVGPVSQTVADLSVSLDAHVQSVDFSMGDGHHKFCQGTGTPWRFGMTPATPSPTCGYTYTQAAAQPYTVTATTIWAVDWNANGASGTIVIPRSSSIQLPVGELRAVTR